MDKDKKRNGFAGLVAGFIIVELIKACMNTVESEVEWHDYEKKHTSATPKSTDGTGAYGKAIKGISDSTMDSYDKNFTIGKVPLDVTMDQAEGIWAIANSDMTSYDKRFAIEHMFK
jgi:hypothetical protein